ncbi:hypothetical protein EJ08DRAFT_646137 [Tothia fuscella]|uniref:DUF2237 domain-containing protein n=1 Tax=Tothia fuscella TaxID=1048955 RepID=A0A9P4P0F1_9PEZI|nr:hypothetical protein EJ08DRAFT_646137 [Tothia fuscella]
MATHSNTNEPKNVLGQTLQLFSKKPLTGFHRDGYCRVSAADMGNHSVAGIVTEEFLDYSASQGNDLRPVGLTEGCKWCLCSGRWLEALEAFKAGKISKNGVPKVQLDATEQSALKKINLDELKGFSAE